MPCSIGWHHNNIQRSWHSRITSFHQTEDALCDNIAKHQVIFQEINARTSRNSSQPSIHRTRCGNSAIFLCFERGMQRDGPGVDILVHFWVAIADFAKKKKTTSELFKAFIVPRDTQWSYGSPDALIDVAFCVKHERKERELQDEATTAIFGYFMCPMYLSTSSIQYLRPMIGYDSQAG